MSVSLFALTAALAASCTITPVKPNFSSDTNKISITSMELVEVSGTEKEKNMDKFFNPYNINKAVGSSSTLSIKKNFNRDFEGKRNGDGRDYKYYTVDLKLKEKKFRKMLSSEYYSVCWDDFSSDTYLISEDDFNGQTPSGKWCVSDSSSYLFGRESNDFNYLYDGNLFIYLPYTHYIPSSKTYNHGYLKYKVHFSDDNYIGEYNSYEQYGMNTAISSGMDSDMDPVLLGGYSLNWNGCEAIALHNLNISLNEDYSSNKYPDRVNNIVDYFNEDDKFSCDIIENTLVGIAAGSVLFPVSAGLTAGAISTVAVLKNADKGYLGVRSGAISDYLEHGDYDYYAINKDFVGNYVFDYEKGKDEFLEKVKTDTDYSRYILSYKNIAGDLSSAIHTIFVEKVNLNRQEKYLVYNAGKGNKKVFFNSFDEILSGKSFVSGWGIKSNGKKKNYITVSDASGNVTSGTGYYKTGEDVTLTSSDTVVSSYRNLNIDGELTFTADTTDNIIISPVTGNNFIFCSNSYFLVSKTLSRTFTFDPDKFLDLNKEHGQYGRHYLRMEVFFYTDFLTESGTVTMEIKQAGTTVKTISVTSNKDVDEIITVPLNGNDITFTVSSTTSGNVKIGNSYMYYQTVRTQF